MDENTIYIELDDEFVDNEVIEVPEKEKTLEEIIEEKVVNKLEQKVAEIPVPKDWKEWPKGKDWKTPTKTELKSIINPLVPTAKEIAEIVLPKIPKPKDWKDWEKGDTLRFDDLTPYQKQILTWPQGSNWEWVPRGGTTGQKLVKKSDRNFDTEWINDTTWTPTLQQVTDEWATTTNDISVPDEAYSASWNGSMEVPTKNALYDAFVPYTWATTDVNIGTHTLITHAVKGDASDWLLLEANNGTDIGILGAGNTANVTWYWNHIYTQMTGGSVPFFASNWLLSQDNQGFYYNDTENRLSLFTTLGSEVLTNGSFTGSATGWTFGSVWSYSSNAVNKSSNGTATLSQTISIYLQREYLLTYTISNWTAGSVTPTLGGFTGTTVSANGTYTERFVATSSAALTFTPTNTARFTIDSVSLKPLTGTSTKSNLNVGGLSIEGSWSNGTPNTTRALTINNDGSNSWIDYRFAWVIRGSEWFNSSGGKDTYLSWGNGQAWYWGNSGLTSNSLIAYLYQSGFVHYWFWYFGWKVNAGSTSTPATTLNSTGSFSTKGRRVTSNYTVTTDDSVIYADASAAACSGTPTYACSHWTNQSDCEKWDAHGGCSWFAGYSCSTYNWDQSGCEWQSGCTYETASCSGFWDESSCNWQSGCSWTNNPQSCSGFDEYTCGSTSGCSIDTWYCSWDGMSCSWGGDCASQMDESSCLSYSYYNGCSGSYDSYSCDGSYYTGNCTGTYGAECQGTSSCSWIDDSTNCWFETGCTWSTSITLNFPSVVTVPNMHVWVYNASSTNADVICQPYSGDTFDQTTSYTLGTYKDSIHAQAFSELTSCSPLSEAWCTPSGCSKTYTACSWDSMSSTCSGNVVCDGIGDQMTCESTTYFSYCSGNYCTVKNWYLLSRS